LADYWYGDFVENRTVVFSDSAMLLDSTDIESEVIAELPVGTELIILGNGAGEFESSGFTSYWYDVSCTLGCRYNTGYIPGAYLAMSDLSLGEDTLFMFNIIGFDEDQGEFQGEVKVVADGELLDSFFFEPVGGAVSHDFYECNTELIQFDPSGLTGVRNLMRLSFILGDSGFINPDLLIAWTGEHLVLGPEAMNEAEAHVYIFSTKYILPSDDDGTLDAVILESTLDIWDEAIEDFVKSEVTLTTYSWTGNSFEPEGAVSSSQ